MKHENEGKAQGTSGLSRRKGCLIALCIPVLLLGSLYAWLALAPTGYEERAKASRTAAEGVLGKRLVSRPQMDPSLEQVRADTPVSPEEAQFRGKEEIRLARWSTDSVYHSRTECFHWDLRDLDGVEIQRKLEAEIRDSKSKPESYESRNKIWVQEYLKTISKRSPEENQALTRNQVENLNRIGTNRVRVMNRIEQFLLENREISDRSPFELHEVVYQTILRAIQEGEHGKAARMIERSLLLSGKMIMAGQWDTCSQTRLESLRLFLTWATIQPEVQDETLDWIAGTLTSWQLTPEEYAVLRTDYLNQYHEILVTTLKKSFARKLNQSRQNNGWHHFFSGIPEKVVTRVAIPLLWRPIYQETEALINQDDVEYEKAHRSLKWVCRVMNLGNATISRPHFYQNQWRGGVYDDFLLEDASSDRSSVGSASQRSRSVFRAQEESRLEAFNRSIAMTRFAFASARYRREHGLYPDSATDLIPRYLDESFATTPDRLWFIFKPEPFTALILPNSFDLPSSATQVLINYAKSPENEGKVPTSIDDLKPYAAPGTDLAPLDRCFVRIDECPVYGLVVRNDPILDERTRADSESGTEGRGGGTGSTGKDSQYLYFPMPLWNPDRGLASPPQESPSAHPSPESKDGDEK